MYLILLCINWIKRNPLIVEGIIKVMVLIFILNPKTFIQVLHLKLKRGVDASLPLVRQLPYLFYYE